MANAIRLRDDVKAKRSSLVRIAAAREVSIDEVREHLSAEEERDALSRDTPRLGGSRVPSFRVQWGV